MQSHYDADLDLVVEMQEAAIGVEEVLQYAQGCFSRDQIRSLLHGLESMLSRALCCDPAAAARPPVSRQEPTLAR